MKKIISSMNKFLAELSGFALIAIIIFLITDVVGREVGRAIQGVQELALFTMIAVVYFGMPHCEEEREHVRVNILIKRLPEKIRNLINFIAKLIIFIFTVFLVIEAGKISLVSYYSREALAGTVEYYIWPVRLCIFIGIIFYSLQVLINAVDEFKKLVQ